MDLGFYCSQPWEGDLVFICLSGHLYVFFNGFSELTMLTCHTVAHSSAELTSLVPLVLCHVCFVMLGCTNVCVQLCVCVCVCVRETESFACINVSESHQSFSVLSCAFSLLVCVCVFSYWCAAEEESQHHGLGDLRTSSGQPHFTGKRWFTSSEQLAGHVDTVSHTVSRTHYIYLYLKC